MKDNFLLKKSQQQVFDALSDEEAGKLIKGIFRYLESGDSGLTGMMNAIFIPIKNDIDKNEETYQRRCEINRQNGSFGGAPKGNKNAQKNKTTENNQKVEKEQKNNPKQHDSNHISYIINHNSYNHNSILEDKGLREKKPFKEIIDYLNQKTGSNYRYSSKTTTDKINARLNEGFTLDDFIVVIDKKVKEWSGTDMSIYLRPETLFGTKFESYLNQQSQRPITTKDLANKIDFSKMKG